MVVKFKSNGFRNGVFAFALFIFTARLSQTGSFNPATYMFIDNALYANAPKSVIFITLNQKWVAGIVIQNLTLHHHNQQSRATPGSHFPLTSSLSAQLYQPR
ncbi:hypothetical protein PM082_014722 [Marasmius tenuissimus]|nr:hypothetical protein PM082_014722 [Marasmius tenuissimus]